MTTRIKVPLDTTIPFTGKSMVGRVFTLLTVVEYAGRRYHKGRTGGKANHFWKCLCKCGQPSIVQAGNLTSGKQVSCGCWKSETTSRRNFRHGHSDHPMYAVWCTMIQRCENPSDKGYVNYGKRGIFICQRWHNFVNFWNDLFPTWKQGLLIDRIDNDGNYEPGNVRWAYRLRSSNNTRRSRYWYLDGLSLTAREWSCLSLNSTKLIYSRLIGGWSVEDAIMKPLQFIRSAS